MQHQKLAALALGLLAILCGAAPADDKVSDSPKLLRHLVLFQFKAGTTDEQVREVVDAFASLPKKIDTIKDFEWGTDVSVENKAAGFTHGFLVTFASKEDRDAYLPHAEHQKFVKLVGPHVEKVLVFDYWSKN